MEQIMNQTYLYETRKKLRNNMSLPEVLLWKKIKRSKLGYKFRRQHSVDNYVLDFYCPKLRLNIEIDGSQHELTKEKDDERDIYFNNLGIIVIRYPATQILNDIDSVLIDICNKIPSLLRRGGANEESAGVVID